MAKAKTLELFAEYVNGELIKDKEGYYVQVRTEDKTSDENCDEMLGVVSDFKKEHPDLNQWDNCNLFADHDTKIWSFKTK